MMCAKFLKAEDANRHGRLYLLTERGFDALLAGYQHTLDIALKHHRVTFGVFVAALVATGVLFWNVPKGFFPIHRPNACSPPPTVSLPSTKS